MERDAVDDRGDEAGVVTTWLHSPRGQPASASLGDVRDRAETDVCSLAFVRSAAAIGLVAGFGFGGGAQSTMRTRQTLPRKRVAQKATSWGRSAEARSSEARLGPMTRPGDGLPLRSTGEVGAAVTVPAGTEPGPRPGSYRKRPQSAGTRYEHRPNTA